MGRFKDGQSPADQGETIRRSVNSRDSNFEEDGERGRQDTAG